MTGSGRRNYATRYIQRDRDIQTDTETDTNREIQKHTHTHRQRQFYRFIDNMTDSVCLCVCCLSGILSVH